MFGKLKKLFSVEQEQSENDDWFLNWTMMKNAFEEETDPQKKEELFSQGYNFILKKAENGDGDAMNELADLYIDESYLPKDPKKAFYWNELSAKSGNISGMEYLGHNYRYGFGTEEDIQQAIYWYTEAAKNGNNNVYFELAELYDYSDEITADEEKSIQYMQMYCKAKGDDKDPILEFAKHYLYSDNDKCNKWFEKSAKSGNTLANWVYGYMLLTGKLSKDKRVIIPQDTGKAKYYLEQSALLGSVKGMGYLANMYANGVGTDINSNIAAMWYQKAIENGNIEELYMLGKVLFTGTDKFSKNIPLAAEFLVHCLELTATDNYDVMDHAASMVILGGIYATESEYQNALMVEKLTGVKQLNGIIGPEYQNIPMAKMLWNTAGNMGMPDGYFNLGVLYSCGDLIPPNHQLANEYFSKSDELCKNARSDMVLRFGHLKNADKMNFIYP